LKISVGTPRKKGEDDIQMDVTEIHSDDQSWRVLVKGRIAHNERASVLVVTNICALLNIGLA
jgi:hypothetical protein